MKYSLSLLILFVFLINNVSSASLNCSTSLIEYYLPTNLTTITNFPTNSNDTLSPGQICRFHFNVPAGYSASIVFSSSIPNGNVTVVDSRNVSKTYQDSTTMQPSYLLSPGGTIYVVVGQSAAYFNMGFKYSKYRTSFQLNYTVSSTSKYPAYLNSDVSYPTVITASTRVSLVTIPQIGSYIPYLQATAVFDGPSVNSTYLGSLYDQYMSDNQFVSSGKTLTLLTIGTSSFTGYGTIILQDYSLTSKFGKFFGLSMELAPINLAMKVPANSAAAFITTMGVSNAEYLISAGVPNNTKIDVYIGSPLADNKIASYNSTNVQHSLPQEFLGIHRTYVVQNGNADLFLGRRTIESGFQNVYVGRKGFVASRFYKAPALASPSLTSDLFSSTTSEKLAYNINIRQLDLSSNNTLTITIDSKSTVYNRTKSASSNMVIYGKTLVVQYQGYTVTNGFYMDFEVTKSSFSMSVIFGVLFSVIFNHLLQ